jgi:pimeloyl-ACP methyl ester carboxylesterase
VWGEADARSPLNVAHETHGAMPDAKLVVIPAAGHPSNFEAPARFNAQIPDFLPS